NKMARKIDSLRKNEKGEQMSKLICSKDIDECHAAGKNICYIEAGTIITPSAKDQLSKYGMKVIEGCEAQCENGGCQSSAAALGNLENANSNELLTLLRQMLAGEIKLPTSA
ncbi:hypothetical protein, partial [Pseudomonas aeruginosa]|uniref:hypothetical protein n=1 Tax=Pseudomonas aeruginosa TaxID=287 RepID=UPI003747B56F